MTPLDDAIERPITMAPPRPWQPLALGKVPPPAPLNRERNFAVWPPFDAGMYLDTNPSFVRLEAGDGWVVFTRYPVPAEPGTGSIWVVRVDDHMQPLTMPFPLLKDGIDPRVIQVGGRVLVFYAILERDRDTTINGACMAIAEFTVDEGRWKWVQGFSLPKQPIDKGLPADARTNWEKNWVPFVIDQTHVGLIYSHDPWDVITLHIPLGSPPHLETLHASPPIRWACGTIRGGTPPVRYDDRHWVTFFHASQVMGSRNVYSVGACVFLNQPPFAPVLMTDEPLLLAPYRTGAQDFGWQFAGSVVFPLGCEQTGEVYRLICGRDDSQIATFVIRQDELVKRLGPVDQGTAGSLHDYRGGPGRRLPANGLLYAPDPIAGLPPVPMINFLRTLAGRGRTFVDVGSHIGGYSMGLAPMFDRVLAFEPSLFLCDWFRRNTALNGYDHVQCHPIALGEARHTATLTVLSGEAGPHAVLAEIATTQTRGHAGMTVPEQFTAPMEPLDDRCLKDVDLLKVAVEGYEIPVLRGAVRTIAASRPVILVEVLADAKRRRDMQALLSGMSYTFEFIFPLSPDLAICLPHERRHTHQWFV